MTMHCVCAEQTSSANLSSCWDSPASWSHCDAVQAQGRCRGFLLLSCAPSALARSSEQASPRPVPSERSTENCMFCCPHSIRMWVSPPPLRQQQLAAPGCSGELRLVRLPVLLLQGGRQLPWQEILSAAESCVQGAKHPPFKTQRALVKAHGT